MAGEVHKVHEEVSINASVEKVFAYIYNAEQSVEWLPSIQEMTNARMIDGVSAWDFKYKMMGFRFEGISKRAQDIPNQKIVFEISGMVPSKWVWLLNESNDGTKLDLTIDYEIPMPALSRLTEGFIKRANENEAKAAMQNIKARLET